MNNKQNYINKKFGYNLSGTTLNIVDMYNKPMAVSGYHGLGGFFDSITGMISKAAKGAADAVKSGVNTISNVASTAAPFITKAMPYIGAALAPVTGGASLSIAPMVQGLMSSMASQAPQMIQQAPGAIPQTFNPMQALQNYMQSMGISPQQLMYSMMLPQMQSQAYPQMQSQAYPQMRGSRRLGASNINTSSIMPNINFPCFGLPMYKALETILNNPMTMFAVLKFQLARPGEDETTALDRHIDVQRTISKVREGVAPEQVLSLLGRTLGAMNIINPAANLLDTSTGSIFKNETSTSSQQEETYIEKYPDAFLKAKADILNRFNTIVASAYPSLTQGQMYIFEKVREGIINSNSEDEVRDTLNNLADLYESYDDTIQKIRDDFKNTYRAIRDASKANDSGFLQLSPRSLIEQAGLISPMQTMTSTPANGVANEILKTSVDALANMVNVDTTELENDLKSRIDLSQFENMSKEAKSPGALELSKVVNSSAISRLKKEGMQQAASLAEQLSKTKLQNVAEQASNVVRDNQKLRAEIDKLNAQHGDLMNKYNDAMLSKNQELVRMLERDKNNLTAKLIKAYGLLDTLRNKLHAFRNAIRLMLENQKPGSMDYQALADLDRDFAEKIALMDSLGIEVAKPEAIEKVWELFSQNLQNNPCYIDALTSQTNAMNTIANRNYDLNALPSQQREPQASAYTSPTEKTMSGKLMGQSIKTFMIKGGGRRIVPLPPQRTMGLGMGNPIFDIISGISQLLPRGANKCINGNPIGTAEIISEKDFPAISAISKFMLAGMLLQLAQDIIIDDSIRAKYVGALGELDNKFGEIANRIFPLIRKYLTGTYNYQQHDLDIDMPTLAGIRQDLDKLLSQLQIFIRKLAWVGTDLYYKGR